MTIQQRLEEIRKIVRNETRVVVSELSRQFDVTEETIRRDLYKLETEGLVTRTYGGAILNQNITYENIDYRRRGEDKSGRKARDRCSGSFRGPLEYDSLRRWKLHCC